MSGDVTTQDLTQGGPAVLVALINEQNLIYLPVPLTVPKATFTDPSSFGGDGANTVITVGTTDPATYGAGTVAVHYTRVDLATLPAAQPALTGKPPTTVNGTGSTTGTGLADAISGGGVTLAANDLVIITGQGSFDVAAATYATGDDFASAISTAANIAGFATFNSSTNQLDFVNTTDHDVDFTTAVGSQAAGLGFPAAVAAAVTTSNYTVADVLAAINASYGLDLAQANVTQTVTTPVTLNGDGSYTQQITAVSNDMLYTGQMIFTFAVPAPVPVAAFTSSANYLAATFTDASTDANGTIAAWAWTFGDGSTSSSQNPTHTYAANGTYSVSLTVTDVDGVTTSFVSHPITVAAIVPTMTAAFTSESAGYTATFTDASTDVNGTLAAWHWDFGDGNTSTVQNPTHAYASAGTYTVQLTVTDANGVTQASVSHLIGISAPVVTASFTQVTTHLSVALTDTSTDTGGTITSWLWNFGDGQTSTLQNPTHLYPTTGSYTVKLTVTDADGVTSSSSSVIVSPMAPPIAANFTFAYGPDGMAVSFTDTSTDAGSSIASWAWDFGDGTGTSTVRNPTYTYTVAGAHTVTLTITDADGETTSVKSETVTPVDTQVAAAFTSAVAGLSVNFTDTSTVTGGTITSWAWTFGDGQSSTQENPTHAYASAGTYTVQLTVMDSTGTANSTITHPVTVA